MDTVTSSNRVEAAEAVTFLKRGPATRHVLCSGESSNSVEKVTAVTFLDNLQADGLLG